MYTDEPPQYMFAFNWTNSSSADHNETSEPIKPVPVTPFNYSNYIGGGHNHSAFLPAKMIMFPIKKNAITIRLENIFDNLDAGNATTN